MKFHLFVGCLIGAAVSGFAQAEPEERKQESNSQFSIRVADSSVIIEEKASGAVRVLPGILWGEDPLKKALPCVMLDQKSSVLLVPMADCSYWLIDLKRYHQNPKDMSGFLVAKIEGGTNRGRFFDRSRAYWGLERLVGKGIIKGTAMNEKDESWSFFIDLDKSRVIVRDAAAENHFFCRAVAGSGDSEIHLEVVEDRSRYDELVKISDGE